MSTRMTIFDDIDHERIRQDMKYPEDKVNVPLERWVTILGEEFGEVAQAVLKGDIVNLDEELVQVAAVAVAALEDIRR